MGLNLGFVGEVLGFQSGGVGPDYRELNLYNPALTREDVDKLLGLYGDLIDAARGGENKFLEDSFQEELSNVLVPLRASFASSQERAKEHLIRSGADPATIARVMADLERGYGSNVAQASRGVAVGQARRKEQFPFQVGALTGNYLTGQQAGAQAENEFALQYRSDQEMQKQARRQKNAATVRKYLSLMAGGGGKDPLGSDAGTFSGGSGGSFDFSGWGSAPTGSNEGQYSGAEGEYF